MAVLYSIRDWDDHFEVSQSRRDGSNKWVALPTKHDGKGYRRIMLRDDGPLIYCAWVLIVQIAAKCPKRGVLKDADGPLTAEDMAIKSSAPLRIFDIALSVLCSKEIGWMVAKEPGANSEHTPSALTLQDRTGQDTTEQDKTKQNIIITAKAPSRVPVSHHADTNLPADDGDDVDFQGDFSQGWADVKSRLSSLGITRWREVAEDAKGNGCTPGHVMELLAHAKAQGYPAGSIVYRVSRARMTLPIAEGWPPKPPDQAAATQRKRSRESADEQAHRDESARSQQAAAERERKFGADLDSMAPEEVAEICKANPAMHKIFRKGEQSPLLRAWLLSQLERRVAS